MKNVRMKYRLIDLAQIGMRVSGTKKTGFKSWMELKLTETEYNEYLSYLKQREIEPEWFFKELELMGMKITKEGD
jgi:hypothetical protein